MKFLIDVQLPPKLCSWIETRGFSARHVMELENGLTLPDKQIWKVASDNNEIVVSKDLDFFELALSSTPPPQVLHINLGNCSNKDLVAYLEASWEVVKKSLTEGARVVSLGRDHINVFD